MKYTRTQSALESALSAEPFDFNFKLFETYKVASKLPDDIFQTMCHDQLSKRISAFTTEEPEKEEQEIENALSGKALNFDPKTNYYRMFWRSYLDNEQLLKELQDLAGENYLTSRKIYNIEDFYEN